MGRREKGQKVDGWLVLDKPIGMTSTEAVARVKRLFNAQKVGHAGTLDPLATGCLPRSRWVKRPKPYPSRWTGKRPTASRCASGRRPRPTTPRGAGRELGQAPCGSGNPRDPPGARRAHHAFPPRFSAHHHETGPWPGTEGEDITLKEPRAEKFWCTGALIECPMRRAPSFAECGKGTSVRALARDIGRWSPTAMSALRRLGSRAVRRGADDFAGKAGGVAP